MHACSKMDKTTLKIWLFGGYSYDYEYREPEQKEIELIKKRWNACSYLKNFLKRGAEWLQMEPNGSRPPKTMLKKVVPKWC